MKAKRFLICLLLPLMLSGCSDSTEVRNMVFVKTIGADLYNNFSISAEIFESEEILSGEGQTIFSALSDCRQQNGKNIFAGHLELFASSPEGMYESLTSLLQNNRISPSCSVLCIPENAAETVKNAESGYLSGLIESESKNGNILKKNISSVVDDLLESDKKATVPVFSENEISMAIISENKLLGTLTKDESAGLCWLAGSPENIYLPINIDGKSYDFLVRKSSSRITAQKNAEKINIIIEIKINGNTDDNSLDFSKVKQSVAEKISGLCAKTIAKTVTGMKADVFGIEKSILSCGITDSRSWEELVSNLNFFYVIKISE